MSVAAPPGLAPTPPPVVRRRGDRGRIYLAIGVVALAAVLVGVGAGTSWYGLRPSSSSGGCPTGVTPPLQGAGAAFPASIISQWTAEFQGATSNAVNYAASGAGQGITELTAATVDFAVTDEPLNGTEYTDLVAAVGTVLLLPVTGGAVVVVYDIPGFTGTLNLTANELVGIYMGTITAWNDTTLVANNAGLKSITLGITAVHRSDAAGMSYVLTNFLSDQNRTWRTTSGLGTSILPAWPVFSGAAGASGNSAVLSAVKAPPKGTGTIGYTDLYDAQIKGLPTAAIKNSAGKNIAPTVADTTSAIDDVYNVTSGSIPPVTENWPSVSWVNASGATDYPLATLAYMLVPQNPGKIPTVTTSAQAAALKEWVAWVATDGQYYSRSYFPFPSPPAPLLAQDLAALPGMNYNGATLPECV